MLVWEDGTLLWRDRARLFIYFYYKVICSVCYFLAGFVRYLMSYEAMSLDNYHGQMLMVDEVVIITIRMDNAWMLLWEDEAFLWSVIEVYFIDFLLNLLHI